MPRKEYIFFLVVAAAFILSYMKGEITIPSNVSIPSEDVNSIITSVKHSITEIKNIFEDMFARESLNDPENQKLLERIIYEMHNIEREKRGLEPLEWDPNLARIAKKHSEWMAKTGRFMHTYQVNFRVWGENIYMGPTGGSVYDVAKEAMKSWMNSKGHRKNILNEKFKRIGVGVACNGTIVYITVEFAG